MSSNPSIKTGIEADSIVERKVTSDGKLKEFLTGIFPSLGARSIIDRVAYRNRGHAITDDLLWVDCDEKLKQIVFADNKTRMACYELTPIATEGRSRDMMVRMVHDLVPLLDGTFPEHEQNPWVMGIYGSLDNSIDSDVMGMMREYASPLAKGSEFTEDYLNLMEEHYNDVTIPGGYFFDDEVSDCAWGGKTARVRTVFFRNYTGGRTPDDPAGELKNICAKFESVLRGCRIEFRKMGGRDFYYWMLAWLNPKPELCDGDVRKLKMKAPYPGDLSKDGELPMGFDMGEAVTLSAPVIDDKTGVWYLDGMPHAVLQTMSIASIPYPGVMTGEITDEDRRYTTIENLPENTTVALTVIFRSREHVMKDVESIKNSASGTSAAAVATRLEVEDVSAYQETTGEPLYPCELCFYINGQNMADLKENVSQATSVLTKAGIRVYDPFMQKDPVRLGNFIRGLPGLYVPSRDLKAARRTRLVHANHAMRIAPIYGRSRGTGRPGVVLFNRSGEPFFFDPLSREDTQLNGHSFIYGSSGSGKSAITINFLHSLMAMHRPRVIFLDMGNSMGPFADYAKSKGVSTYRATLSMDDANVSLPPFASALKLIHDDIDVDEKHVLSDEEQISNALADEDDESAPARDIMGELEIIARLMIQGTDGENISSATLKVIIRKAIQMAADKAVKGDLKYKIPRPVDVAACINEIGQRDEYKDRQSEITEMASAMELFCDGLNGHLFNGDGKQWPEVDFTVVEMGEAAKSGRTDTLVIAIVSLIMHIDAIAERDQFSGRPIVFAVDEAHMITNQQLLMTLLIKITKMWRKLGARFWLITQEIDDIPPDVERMIGMMENWIAMKMPIRQVEKTSGFRALTPEQMGMMGSSHMCAGRYSEGCFIRSSGDAFQFRAVPPSLTLALAATGSDEKKVRREIMNKHGIDEIEAIIMQARDIRESRLKKARERLQEFT